MNRNSELRTIFLHPRFFTPLIAFSFYLLGCFVLRSILGFQFADPATTSFTTFAKLLVLGERLDLAMAFWLFLPLVLWFVFVPDGLYLSKIHKTFLVALLFLYFPVQIFLLKADYEFFSEFNARFNTVAVDYLIYPHEVFVNLWDSYPITRIVMACLWGGGFLFTAIWNLRLNLWQQGLAFRRRLVFLAGYIVMGAVFTQTVSIENTHFTNDRVLNEISSNGQYSFFYSALTHHLDYPAFYRTLPRDEAYVRVRSLVNQPNAAFTSQKDSIQRTITNTSLPKPKNLVILLIESFGSEFWGSLGREGGTLTPEMDALSEEGFLFTNLYASGNRTVRGIEGVTASFPPLPGDSIVKRHLSDHVATIALTLHEKNYQTVYLYGGRGVFDGMRSFALRNGFDRFVEQKDFPDPTFTTIWGVSDEDLYHRSVEEFKRLHASGKPFFATVLSVSNHKPYTYPSGRIPEDPNAHSRSHAVKYTDWALGEFFRLAKKEEFCKDTIFAVVADHGARVYGSQSIPIKSYRIPLLILNPSQHGSRRIDTLGGSLDVSPTLLGMLGLSYESVFFGRDLMRISKNGAWAVMHHNRDVGMYRDGRMVVLGLNKTIEFYEMNDRTKELSLIEKPNADDLLLEKDATALFQIADELYTHEKFHTR